MISEQNSSAIPLIAIKMRKDRLDQQRDETSDICRLMSVALAYSQALEETIALAERLQGALLDLVVNVQDYEAWQRPCLSLDKARELLRNLNVEPQ